MLFNSLEFLFLYLPVLLGSIVFNYLVGYALARGDDVGSVRRKRLLWLGISFFTFTQIAFLVDAARGKSKELDFIHYTLFVTYFPHLIAGPVLHHKEMMPQFAQASTKIYIKVPLAQAQHAQVAMLFIQLIARNTPAIAVTR